jgi:hypothetical protein
VIGFFYSSELKNSCAGSLMLRVSPAALLSTLLWLPLYIATLETFQFITTMVSCYFLDYLAANHANLIRLPRRMRKTSLNVVLIGC